MDWLNRDSVEEELLRDCDHGARRISITQETCDDLKARCFDHWQREFGSRPNNETITTVHRSSMFVLDNLAEADGEDVDDDFEDDDDDDEEGPGKGGEEKKKEGARGETVKTEL